ncbi:MAG: hypothetical protein S4CHLAM6_09480 [Chlamydiae bacterium]|nr:hypothetical protein [Chlamydiota bacterium]
MSTTSTRELINCLPYNLTIYDAKTRQPTRTFFQLSSPPHLVTKPQKAVEPILFEDGSSEVPVCTPQVFERIEGLPPYNKSNFTAIIVSDVMGKFLQKNPSIWDGKVYGPDIGEGAVRDSHGQILGTTRLVQYIPSLHAAD